MDPNNYDMASQLGGPSKSIAVFKGNIRPLHDRVIVREMNFGEMKTKAGLIIMSDDGKNHAKEQILNFANVNPNDDYLYGQDKK